MNKSKSITLLTAVIILFTGIHAFSQKDTAKLKTNKENIETYSEQESYDVEDREDPKDKIFVYVKKMPEFPGGNIALRKYIAENLKWTEEARDGTIQGTIYLRFEVKKTGEIGKVELQKRS